MKKEKSSNSINDLERQINRGRYLVWVFVIFVMSLYVVAIYKGLIQIEVNTAERFGQFGDYVGGLMNPVVAFAALYWLTRSILLQKQELADMRVALESTETEQAQQAKYALIGVRLQGLNAMVGSITADIQVQRSQIEFLVNQVRLGSSPATIVDLDGTQMTTSEVNARLITQSEVISKRMAERAFYEQEIRTVLESNCGAAVAGPSV